MPDPANFLGVCEMTEGCAGAPALPPAYGATFNTQQASGSPPHVDVEIQVMVDMAPIEYKLAVYVFYAVSGEGVSPFIVPGIPLLETNDPATQVIGLVNVTTNPPPLELLPGSYYVITGVGGFANVRLQTPESDPLTVIQLAVVFPDGSFVVSDPIDLQPSG